MIHWTWLLVAFFCGVVFGIFMVALLEAGRRNW